jgi:hypothetical protein
MHADLRSAHRPGAQHSFAKTTTKHRRSGFSIGPRARARPQRHGSARVRGPRKHRSLRLPVLTCVGPKLQNSRGAARPSRSSSGRQSSPCPPGQTNVPRLGPGRRRSPLRRPIPCAPTQPARPLRHHAQKTCPPRGQCTRRVCRLRRPGRILYTNATSLDYRVAWQVARARAVIIARLLTGSARRYRPSMNLVWA